MIPIDELSKAKYNVRVGSIITQTCNSEIIEVSSIEYDPIADAKYDGKMSRALINGLYWYVDDIVVIKL